MTEEGSPTAISLREALNQAQASEVFYRRLFETAQDGIILLDAETGQITHANPFLENLLGYTLTELRGKRLREIEAFRDPAARHLDFGVLQEKECMRWDDLRLMPKKGKPIHVEFVSNRYVSGDKKVIQCNLRDITERKQANATEKEAQRFDQSTLDALESHIAVLDHEGRIITANQAWRRFYEENGGTAASCGIGANYLGVCDQSTGPRAGEASRFAQGIRQVMTGQQPVFCLEYPCHSSDEERWFTVCVTRFAGEGPLRVVVAHENITDRKQTEENLRQSEANLAKSQQMAHLGSWELDLSNLEDIDANPLHWSDEIYRILGYTPGEFEPSNDAFFRAVHPDDRENLSLAMTEAIRGGKPYAVDHRIVLPDGQERIVHAEAEVIFSEASGRPLKIVGLGQDITERTRIEQQLQTHSHLLNVIGQAAVVTDLAGTITYWNHFAETLYGWSSAAAQGRNISELTPTGTTHQQAAEIRNRLMQGESWSGEFIAQKRDGTTFPAYVTATPLWDEAGHVVGSIGLSVDITERKQAEEALEAKSREIVTIWESMTDAFFSLDAQWCFTYINSQAADTWQINAEELIGKNIWEQFPAAVGLNFYEEYHRAVKDQVPVHFEGLYSPRNKWREVRAYPSRAGLSVYFHDITERKQSEEQLRFQKTLLEAQSEASPDGILVVSGEGKILSHNQRFLHLWEIPHHIVADGEDAPLLQAVLQKLADPQTFSEKVRYLYEHRDERSHDEIFLLDGRVFDRYSAPITSASGAYYGRVWYFRDVTERKQAETLLRESQQRLALATESAQIGIWDWDVAANQMVWDTQMVALYGIRMDDFSGAYHTWGKGLHPEDRAKAEVELKAALDGGEVFHPQFRVVWPSGEVRHMEAHALVQRAPDGSALRMTGVNWDITERKQAEASLRRSEERYRSLALATTQIVWVADANGVIEDMPAWREFTGQRMDEMRGWDWMEAMHPEDREPTLKIWARSVETKSLYETEYRVRAANGAYRLFAVRGVPVLEGDGNIREWVGTCTDIHDIRKAEEELDRFFTLSLDMLVIIGSDGYMKRLNPAFEVTLGFSPAEMMAVPFMDFVHPDDHIATQAEAAKLARGALVIQFENRYRCRDGSYRWLRWMCAPHEELWYCVAHDITGAMQIAVALQKANDELEVRVEERTAELAQINSALLDQITEREEAEAETRARARQQEAVAELGHRALVDGDMDVLLNGATALVTATLDVELSSILELMPGGETLRFRAATGWKKRIIGQQVPAHPRSQAGYALLHRTPMWVSDLRTETRFTPSPLLLEQGIASGTTIVIGSHEKPFGTLGAHTTRHRHFSQNDIHFLQAIANVLATALERNRIETEIRQLNAQLSDTNQKLKRENVERQIALGTLQEVSIGLKQAKEEAEQAKENAEIANRAKSEFLSRMSHELRTPLNAILGFGQILEKQDLTPLSKESIGYILSGGRHLLDLINEVLDIARVEAGHLEIALEPIALNDIVPEACALMSPLATERGIRLEADTKELGRCHLLADRQRLKQVLINLLSNAIKYNREGGQVEVTCGQTSEERISIAVRDTGPGIAPQDLRKLFTPFERLNASATGIEGTGLGLVLSQRLMTAMGGTLAVESTLGRGTILTLELAQAAPSEAPLANGPEERHHFGTRRTAERAYTVLCMEDNLSNLRLMEVLFQGRPEITLLVAMQGSVGLDMARQHEPDVILLDLNLPDIHGKEVLTRLQQSALTRDIPVVVISADATPNQVERLLAAGAKTFLTKPLDVGLFLHTVDTFLLPAPPSVAAQLNEDEEIL